MQLNSPRTNPYSSLEKAKEKLKEKGYSEIFTVFDEDSVKTENGKTLKAQDLVINHLIRLTKNKVFLSEERKSKEPVILYALSAKNGSKGIIEEHRRAEGAEVVEAFLRNVDSSNSIQEFYSA
jgi:hypothetical protein